MITPKWQFVDQDQANIQLQKLVDAIEVVASNLNMTSYHLRDLVRKEKVQPTQSIEKVYVEARVNLYGIQALITELLDVVFPKLELTPELEPDNDD